MITRRGAGLLIVSIALLVFAGTTRVGWLLLLDALLWGALVLSLVLPWLATGKVRARARTVSWEGDLGPMVGDTGEIELALHNAGILPSVFLTIPFDLPPAIVAREGEGLFLAWLGRNRSVAHRIKVGFRKRGRHALHPAKGETSLPFGLFRRRTDLGEGSEVLIYPRAHPLAGLELLGVTGATSQRYHPARLGEHAVGSRRYVAGDSVRQLHWRNTARAAYPQVKEFERPPDDALVIVFGASGSAAAADDHIESAIEIAASVGSHLCASEGLVRVLAGPLDEVFTRRDRLLTELALFDPTQALPLEMVAREIDPVSNVLAIVSDIDWAGLRAVAAVASGRARVTAMLLTWAAGGQPSSDARDALSKAAVTTVDCPIDEIPRALAELAQRKPVGVG